MTRIRSSLGLEATVRSSLLVREVVEASIGRDRRMFVAGEAVQATMDRVARPGEWRSNLSLGARPYAAAATADEAHLATAAVAALGLDFGTVDIMTSDSGPVIIEVNAFGDVLDVAMLSGVDLIGCLTDAAEARAGLRSCGSVTARPLTDLALAQLTSFCWDRWDAKLETLPTAPLSAR